MNWFSHRVVGGNTEQHYRIAQITDCHLLAAAERYRGVDSTAHLSQVLATVATQNYDCVLVTGDVAQDHSADAYQKLKKMLTLHLPNTPIGWLPGNHDELAALFDGFSAAPFVAEKHLQLGHWQLLLLNTKSTTPAGEISADDLSALGDVINHLPPDKPIAVFCHHHPLAVNCDIDRHILLNTEQLFQQLGRSSQLKMIAYGHVHNEYQQQICIGQNNSVSLLATPSTAVQFKAAKSTLDKTLVNDDSVSFGYRQFDLAPDGQWHSAVIWLTAQG